MQITAIEIKNFRCFASFKHIFNGPLTIIEGPNGSGKTSLIEALHYMCYGKSFRTHNTQDLSHLESNAFFVKISIKNGTEQHNIQIGYSEDKRAIKVDGKKIDAYKDLIQHYRTITITEDDILIIKGAPEFRRTFLDQSLLLHQPAYAAYLKEYRKVLKQRTALLLSDAAWSQESYIIWTEKLWNIAQNIQTFRIQFLEQLECEVQALIQQFFPELPLVQLIYKKATPIETVQAWMALSQGRERQTRRTLFGPHIDDFDIIWGQNPAKMYASRGQQKLLAVLIKVTHCFLLNKQAIVLLDDFMTDFDDNRACSLLDLFLKKQVHLICTVPSKKSVLAAHLQAQGAEVLELPNLFNPPSQDI